MEKESCNLPQEFCGWGNLENAPEAVFAVLNYDCREEEIKKLPQCNRNMNLDDDAYEQETERGTRIVLQPAKQPETFERKLKESYNNRNNSFTYNNKVFCLKTNKEDDELIYICDENTIFGTAYTDGKTIVLDLDEDKKNQIFGFESTQPLEYYKKNTRIRGNSLINK